jgi:hypothetical protein
MPFQDSLLVPRPPWLLDGLAAIHRHQLLLPHQVAALVGDAPDRVAEGLDALRADGLLATVRAASFRALGTCDAFMLTAAGLLALQRNELGAALEGLDRDGRLTLERWATARAALGFAAHRADRGVLRRIPLVADAFAVVRRMGRVDALLVEVDMGSVSLERMRAKYAGYVSWWLSGGPAERFGLRSLRVLTLAATPERMTRLLDAAADANSGRGLGFLWFGTLDGVDASRPESLLAPTWVRGDRPGERSALWA